MSKHPFSQAFGPAINRFGDCMAHTNRYAFNGVARIAEDAKVSASSVSRLVNGKQNPSFVMVARLTTALEHELGFRIDPRDLVAELGGFLSPHMCEVVHCAGCLPDRATDEFGDLKKAWQGVLPGTWITSRYPNGFQIRKGAA